jgi:hypothetical protein
VAWDLRYQGAETIKGAKIDAGNPAEGPLATPGTYTLRLTVDGKVLTTKLEIQPDPRLQLAAAELTEQLTLALALRDDINRLARMVNQLRAIKGQLKDKSELLKDNARAESLLKLTKELIDRLDALEGKLHNPRAQVVYDILAQRGGAKLYSQFSWLFELLKDSDGAPNQGIREQYADRSQELRQYEDEWKSLLSGELARFNESAGKLAIPSIIVPAGDAGERKVPAPRDGEADPLQVRAILDEITTLPLQPLRRELLPEAGKLPPFAAKALQAHAPDSKDSPLRAAVVKARKVLEEQLRGKAFREEVGVPRDAVRANEEIKTYQTLVLAPMLAELTEALEELQEAGKERAKEPSRRWQANYDYVLARLLLQLACLYEYSSLLGEMRRDPPPLDPKGQKGWRVAAQETMRGDFTGKKLAREAHQTLEKLVQEHPGTPWAELARRDLQVPLRLTWQPVKQEGP